MTKNIHLFASARPNFMKIAPLYHALVKEDDFDVNLVHGNQHYDANMSDAFFSDLNLPTPDFHLGVGSGTHAEQTGRTMIAYEQVCIAENPDCVIVVGDVNATAAVALVCAKLLIPVIHLEAGLRSRDRTMPEEINRIVTDAISDLLWTPSPDADQNLIDEGVSPDRIEMVGNIMIDSFEMMRQKIESANARSMLGVENASYGVVTLHRPSNVDDPQTLASLVDQLVVISARIKLVFPVHPRTRARLISMGLMSVMEESPEITVLEPMGYVDFMNIVTGSDLVITDSGGVQEETTYLGIPCITLRPNTERPITVSAGTNRLSSPADLSANIASCLDKQRTAGQPPKYWDGHTAGRCVTSLKRFLKIS